MLALLMCVCVCVYIFTGRFWINGFFLPGFYRVYARIEIRVLCYALRTSHHFLFEWGVFCFFFWSQSLRASYDRDLIWGSLSRGNLSGHIRGATFEGHC